MIWLVWRRRRAAMILAGALVVAAGLFLLAVGATGPEIDVRRGPPTPVVLVRLVMLVLPGVLGIVLGAGLFSRELEQGTHVFTLTQSVSRLRWWATNLLVSALPAVVAVALLSWLAAWSAGGAQHPLVLHTPFFDGSGVLPVVHLLVAFTVTATVGLVLGNALAAVAVGVGVVLVAQIVPAAALRPHYLPPQIARADVAVVESSVPLGGHQLDTRFLGADGSPVETAPVRCLLGPGPGSADCLRRHGIAEVELRYQPDSRYWPFQGIEAAPLLALSLLAVGAGWWGLRRRVR